MKTHKTVESFRVDAIKDFPLSSHVEGLPFSRDELQSLLENCPVIVTDPNAEQDSLPFNVDEPDLTYDYHLQQPSDAHKRSFEIVKSSQKATWTDEYGNTYGALTLKGNNFSNPSIMEHATASEGFIAYGLQESSVIERVLRASDALRARNITTEHTIGLAEPKQYPWPVLDAQSDAYEMVSLKEYKRRIIDAYWQGLPDENRTPEALADLYQKFQDMTFYISLRATDTAYRLHDMGNPKLRESVFEYINQQGLLPENSDPLDAANPADIKRYLTQLFGPSVGRNFARLHVDMSHRFAHGYNMSALGSIVDLDSIHGTPLGLGDAEVTDADRALDLADIISAVNVLEHTNITLGYPTEGSLRFLDAYISETIDLHPTRELALTHLERVCTKLAESIRTRRAALNISGPDVLLEYINDKLFSLVTETIPGDQLTHVYEEARKSIGEVIADDAIDALVDENFRNDAELYISEIVDEYVNEITDAANTGEVYDIMSDLRGCIMQPSSHIGSMMIDQVLATYYGEFERRFSEMGSQATDVNSRHPLEALLRRTVGRHTLNHYADDLRGIAMAKVTGLLLPTLEEDLLKASTFTMSDSMFDGYSSFLSTGLNTSHLWRCTEYVDLEEAIEYLTQPNVTIEIEELDGGADNRSIAVPAYTPGVRVEEIISDTRLDGWSHGQRGEQKTLNITYEENPSYLLIRETLDGDIQRLRLQLPSASMQLIQSGALSLSRILPTFEQPMLF